MILMGIYVLQNVFLKMFLLFFFNQKNSLLYVFSSICEKKILPI